ncbi:hypothetical protein O3P69_007215 [Scylla paramamosain]|uniref:Ribosome-binding factor A, mitochondrial n=1 Tax=Scylla paramamosain TaxID=85552 RepID=A0AAW0V6R0_SCYPA
MIKEAIQLGMNRAMIIRLGVMGGVSCGRRGLTTGQTTLSRSAVYRMLVKESNKRKKKHMNFGMPRMGETATVVTERWNKMPKVPKYSSRLRNLNKVFLDKITDILSTGELASQLYGRGLELSEVCIHPNLHGINVYWVTTGNPEKDQQTQEFLNCHAKAVRHELSNLRIIGHSPPITFLRDDRHHKLQEVERLLAIADFGEDFEPTSPAHHRKGDFPSLALLLDTRIKDAIKDLEGEDGQKEDPPDPFEEALRIATSQPPQGVDINDATFVLPSDLPTMKGDVLGVNAIKLYNMIHQSMKRARAEHRREAEIGSQGNLLDHHPQESMSLVSNSGKQAIQKWASQYRQMQKETRKKNKEAALLSYPGDLSYQDLPEQDMEVEWVEEEDYTDQFE